MFELSIPKNPIHYIENGFEPTSAISYDPISGSTDWDSSPTRVVVTAYTQYSDRATGVVISTTEVLKEVAFTLDVDTIEGGY